MLAGLAGHTVSDVNLKLGVVPLVRCYEGSSLKTRFFSKSFQLLFKLPKTLRFGRVFDALATAFHLPSAAGSSSPYWTLLEFQAPQCVFLVTLGGHSRQNREGCFGCSQLGLLIHRPPRWFFQQTLLYYVDFRTLLSEDAHYVFHRVPFCGRSGSRLRLLFVCKEHVPVGVSTAADHSRIGTRGFGLLMPKCLALGAFGQSAFMFDVPFSATPQTVRALS